MECMCTNMLTYDQNASCTGYINPVQPSLAGCTQYLNPCATITCIKEVDFALFSIWPKVKQKKSNSIIFTLYLFLATLANQLPNK
jgi:hypothetical protein